MIKYFKVTLGDMSKVVKADVALAVAGEMVEANGNVGCPKVERCDERGNLLIEKREEEEIVTKTAPNPVHASQMKTLPPPTAKPVYSNWDKQVTDESAKTRIEDLHKKIGEGGITIDTSQQLYATGTRMAEDGYRTQSKREKNHFKQQLLKDAIEELEEKVANEIRRDVHVSAKDIADMISVEDNKLCIKDHVLTEHALHGIMTRLESPALGYLLGLQSRIASYSMNAGVDHDILDKDVAKLTEILQHECKRYGDVAFKLRMREYPNDIYAATSQTFGVADAPMVMEQILDKMPDDARGSWAYDPETTSWELRAEIWTPTPVAQQAVGEPFSGHVSFTSRDNSTGRFNGGGGINILRCLNASTYSAGEGVSRVHRGKIMFDIDTMVRKSLTAINVLCEAWGIARKSKVEIPTGTPIEKAIPGFWRALLKEGELSKVLVGRKENHIKELSRAYFDERRDKQNVVVADFGQSWTRFIQSQPIEIRRDGEAAIGAWMVKPSKMRCDLKEKE